MQPGKEFNLDSWRVNRAKERRQDDQSIDLLADALIEAQAEISRLKSELEKVKNGYSS